MQGRFALMVAAMVMPAVAQAEDAAIVVSASTPLSGAADSGRVLIDAKALRAMQALSVSDALARQTPGVVINEVQGNPLQSDLSFRGYTASPLLGTPQGIAVYVDGVRANQPFGEVVSWDLLPSAAMEQVTLVEGAAPQFGRNALGGALSIRTKDGRSAPGIAASVSGGSYGRLRGSIEAGGKADNGLHWYGALEGFQEDGWRYASASKAWKGFAKAGWEGANSGISLSFNRAQSDLNGNGLQDYRLLARDWRSVYTSPDNTRNIASQITLSGHHRLSENLTLSANAFWRSIVTRSINGDMNEGALGESLYQPNAAERAALTEAGYTGFPISGETQANTAFPKWRCIANVLLNGEPNEKCNGLLTRSSTRQQEWGGAVELGWTGMGQHLTVGASYAQARARFIQNSQFGYLLSDHSVVAVSGPGAFADGTQNSENAFDARVDLHSRISSLGLYAADVLTLGSRVTVTLAGRYDRTQLHNRDQITPGGGTGSLDADPVFARFNPSAMVDWHVAHGLTITAQAGESSRAPSAVELGCSDPASPCRLPNAMAGDPPLRQVVARSLSLGARIERKAWNLRLTAFRSDNHDDIQFIAGGASGFGYFANVGTTRRQGIEASGAAHWGRWQVGGSYTLLDATYRTPLTLNGGSNSSNDAAAPGFDGEIAVRPGDRLPLLPRHLFKAQAGFDAASWLSVRAEMVAAGGVYARGNENNLHQPDGTYYLGAGKTDAYAVVNASLEIRPRKGVIFTAGVSNLMNAHYATAAQLAASGFDANGAFVARPFSGPVIGGERPLVHSTFLAPAAPRRFEVGLRVQL
ncbi:TonB-dependent receptor [Novosphingobium sp. SG707]|uniref:TonB-dependent receptor n=1 Tax=Novosphingobium sp. SG707 TaxID=2586996 RepID=UPI001445D943|nr:TonB-dependent receptor [Novosphingobium sp. SG707]NKI99156.1 outer membrane receptor protein involved in Fe transport [Novosphingobium sp. SG707]